jgi:hypothetical protein
MGIVHRGMVKDIHIGCSCTCSLVKDILVNKAKQLDKAKKKEDSFPPNWVGRNSFNLVYKSDMCPLNI